MSAISLFYSLPEKGKPHTSNETISIDDFLNAVKFGRWKGIIEPIRNEENKEKRSQLKKSLPSVTISGTFAERKQDQLIQHSGFIAIDVDNNNDSSKLQSDPYVYALFTSVSGLGFCALFKIDEEKHKESFNWLRNYLFNTYGYVVDPAPSNVASLRYVSFDPNLFFNEKAKKSKALIEKQKQIKSLPIVLGDDGFGELVNEAYQRGVNLTDTYEDYRNVAFAIANGFGETGRNAFHKLASISAKYNSKHADKQYDIALADKGSKKITIGSLYHMMKSNGLHIKNDNHKALTVATLAKKSNRTPEAVEIQLIQHHGLNQSEAHNLVKEVFERADITLNAVTNDPEKLIESMVEFINQNYNFKKNMITGKIENNGTEMEEEDFNTAYLKLRSVFNNTAVTFDLMMRIIISRFTPHYNPIIKYIDENRHRNTSGNIDALISHFDTSTKQAPLFIRKWLLGMVGLIYGEPCRLILTLCGNQENGKTEFFRRLLPSRLRPFYAESKLDRDKDDEILMCQKLIVMDDEMGGKSKSDEKKLKELSSKDTFSLRAPYGKHNQDFKRLAIICGTSNELDVLTDATGNTRVLPIEVIRRDFEKFDAIDKDELFMEVVRAYESGERFNFTREESAELQSLTSKFEATPYERELILQYLCVPINDHSAEYMSTTEIKNYIEMQSGKQQIKNMKRFGIELRKMFGESRVIRVGSTIVRKYGVSRLGQPPINNISSQQEDDLPF